jgi:large subunit ribosomal protein L4
MIKKCAPESRRTLLITSGVDKNLVLSARNLPRVEVRTADDLNALDVLKASHVVLAKDAIGKLEERLT